jgi:hypothetical protein
VTTSDEFNDVFKGLQVERKALSRSSQSVVAWDMVTIRLVLWKSYRFEWFIAND